MPYFYMVAPLALAALRALARRHTRNARAKIRRLEKQGIKIAGSAYDPTTALENLGRYNTKQVQKYIERLNEFTSRSTKFVAGDQGAPIPWAEWGLTMLQQKLYNTKAAQLHNRLSHVKLPGQDMTVGERKKQKTRSWLNAPDNEILPEKNLGPESFTDVKRMRRFREMLSQRIGPKYVKYRRESSSRALSKALREIDATDLDERFNNLTARQKEALIFDTDFYEAVFAEYPEDGETGENANTALIETMIEWAEQLDA